MTEVVDRLRQGPRLDEARDLGEVLAKASRPTRQDKVQLARRLREASPSVAGRVLVYAGSSKVRDAVLAQLHAWAAGDPDNVSDSRSTAVLFVFALKEKTRSPGVGERHQERLAGARDALGTVGRQKVTRLLEDDRERAPDDGVLEMWRTWTTPSGPSASAPRGGAAAPTSAGRGLFRRKKG